MKEPELKQLKALHRKYVSAKRKHYSELGIFIAKLSEITGKEIQYNEFESDGLGVCAGYGDTYMSVSDAVALIKQKGTIDEDDFTYM